MEFVKIRVDHLPSMNQNYSLKWKTSNALFGMIGYLKGVDPC
jgi:hypothetical protein